MSSRAKTVHHRHDDDQRRDAQHDADEGEAGDDGDEGLLAARRADSARRPSARRPKRGGPMAPSPSGPRLPPGYLVRRVTDRAVARGQPSDVNLLIAASIDSVSRSPVLRSLSSTSPLAIEARPDDDLGRARRSGRRWRTWRRRGRPCRHGARRRPPCRAWRRASSLAASQAASPAFMLITHHVERRDRLRPDDAVLVMGGLDDAPARAGSGRCRRSPYGPACSLPSGPVTLAPIGFGIFGAEIEDVADLDAACRRGDRPRQSRRRPPRRAFRRWPRRREVHLSKIVCQAGDIVEIGVFGRDIEAEEILVAEHFGSRRYRPG